jgi:hypothetical protein
MYSDSIFLTLNNSVKNNNEKYPKKRMSNKVIFILFEALIKNNIIIVRKEKG